MGGLEFLVLLLGVLLLIGTGALLWKQFAPGPADPWAALEARRVVVNLKSGRAVDGYLVHRAGDLLFLKEATALEPGAEPLRLDGSAVIQRADVDFIQAL